MRYDRARKTSTATPTTSSPHSWPPAHEPLSRVDDRTMRSRGYCQIVRVQLDGTQIRTEADFHRHVAALLDFGPYYGHNLDALWDRLSTDVPRPVHLIWAALTRAAAPWEQRLSTESTVSCERSPTRTRLGVGPTASPTNSCKAVRSFENPLASAEIRILRQSPSEQRRSGFTRWRLGAGGWRVRGRRAHRPGESGVAERVVASGVAARSDAFWSRTNQRTTWYKVEDFE